MDFLKVILVSMLPIAELRGSIPLGLALGLNPTQTFLISVFFNSLVFFPVYFGLEWFYERLFSKIPFFERILERIRKKGSKYVEKYELAGLIIFVSVPTPFTGAYSGSALAWLFGIEWKKSFLAIFLGVLIAGIIVSIASLGLLAGLDFLVGI